MKSLIDYLNVLYDSIFIKCGHIDQSMTYSYLRLENACKNRFEKETDFRLWIDECQKNNHEKAGGDLPVEQFQILKNVGEYRKRLKAINQVRDLTRSSEGVHVCE